MKQDRTLRDVLAQILSRITFIDGSFAKANRFIEVLDEWKGEPPRHKRLVIGFDSPHSSYQRVLEQADHFMRLELQMRIKYRDLKETSDHDLKMFKEDYQKLAQSQSIMHDRMMAWKTLKDIYERNWHELGDEYGEKLKALEEELKMFKQEEKERDVDLITPSGNVVPMRRKGTTQPPSGTDTNWLSPLKVGDVFLAQRFQQRPDGSFALAPILEEYQISVNEKEYVKLLTTLNLDDTEITVDPVEFCKGWNLKAVIGHVIPE